MKKDFKYSKIIIIIAIFLIIMGSISIIFYKNLKKQETITAEATVTYIGNNYIVVSDENGEEYSLKTNHEYNVGDKVSFTIKDVKKDSYPKEGAIERLDIISKNVEFSISDTNANIDTENKEQETTSPEKNNSESAVSETPKTESPNVTNPTPNTETTGEAGVISYFETLNTSLDTYNQNKSLGQSIKTGFVSVVDFLFYGGTIKGKTFNELSTSAKLKVLKLAFSIDKKIEQYFPGYKEQISSTSSRIYTNVKAKALELYLNITTKVCKNNEDTCQTAKEGLSDLKSSFSLTWDFIKDISGVGLSKLKEWYEVWREA